MSIKKDIETLSLKYFNEEIDAIPEKIETNLAELNTEEKSQRIPTLIASLYSQAALNANSKVLSDILSKI